MPVGGGHRLLGLPALTIAVVGVITATAGLLIYRLLAYLWCHYNAATRGGAAVDDDAPGHTPPPVPLRTVMNFSDASVEQFSSVDHLIPTCQYSDDVGTCAKTEDYGTCAVCLAQFAVGEPVRVLPECLHIFHAGCIDTWLFQHSDCPVCRTDTGVRGIG
ncbi:unnamed protein product [Linum tenue]|uniref:RING-type E3 ubiquitin transferase n=1 Tax=Linum tenue TaxID=586396 RepID=A0AAV0M7K0_9ROSI|nr:unnamed protein product [Linum tenue]